DRCRVAYAWSGNFLDATPVWNNRGGNPADLLGPIFWHAPPGHPWAIVARLSESGPDSESRATVANPPDFAAMAKDPAYGAAVPNEQIYQGPKRLHFDGYTLAADGRPTFRYRVESPQDRLNGLLTG